MRAPVSQSQTHPGGGNQRPRDKGQWRMSTLNEVHNEEDGVDTDMSFNNFIVSDGETVYNIFLSRCAFGYSILELLESMTKRKENLPLFSLSDINFSRKKYGLSFYTKRNYTLTLDIKAFFLSVPVTCGRTVILLRLNYSEVFLHQKTGKII